MKGKDEEQDDQSATRRKKSTASKDEEMYDTLVPSAQSRGAKTGAVATTSKGKKVSCSCPPFISVQWKISSAWYVFGHS